MWVHRGENPHKCDLCFKSLTKYGNLKTHMRIHSGEKPYVCNECHRGFAAILCSPWNANF